MPFPLAHPAAVLPLRRYCPRWLSFPALIIGSLCPDAGYFFGDWDVDVFAHRLAGSVGFCVPAGLLLLWMAYRLRSPVVKALPAPYRQALLPLCQRPWGSPVVLVVSLLIGAWTHLLLDAVGHKHGWLVEHLPLLRFPVAVLGHRTLRVFHLFSGAFTFAGAAWLGLACQQGLAVARGSGACRPARQQWRNAILFATVVLLADTAHYLFRRPMQIVLLGAFALLLAAGLALRLARQRNVERQTRLS